MKDYFHNSWHEENGLTEDEGLELIKKINYMYRVGKYNSKWKSAVLVRDPKKKEGFMIMIEKAD